MTTWDIVFGLVVNIEAGFTKDPRDPGNFTPAGVLKGTKYGISARGFPDVDIENLTVDQAKALAKPRFWDAIRGDQIHPWLGLIMFDSSYNEGPEESVKHLQVSLGLAQNGRFDGQTLMATELRITKTSITRVMLEYTTQRNLSYTRDTKFSEFGHSWLYRTAEVLVQATTLHS